MRGDIYRVPNPSGDTKASRAFVVVSRQEFVAGSFSTVICAPVYSEQRGISTEVAVGTEEGLKHPSVILCDALVSLSRRKLTNYVGALDPEKRRELDRALRIALALE